MKPLIVNMAVDLDAGIAKDGKIPWNIPADRANFRRLTSPHDPQKRRLLVCGPKTYATLPDSVAKDPRRPCLVVGATGRLADQHVLRCDNIGDAIDFADQDDAIEAVHVIGGVEVFEQAIKHPRAACLHLTQVLFDFQCDRKVFGNGWDLADALDAANWRKVDSLTRRFKAPGLEAVGVVYIR